MPDNISALYNELKNTYDVGSEDDFRQYLNDAGNREALRKELSSEWDTGDEKAWNEYLGFGGDGITANEKETGRQTGQSYDGRRVVNRGGEYGYVDDASQVEAEKRSAKDKGMVGNMVDNVRNILQDNLAGGGAGIGNVVGKTVAAGQMKVAAQPQAQQESGDATSQELQAKPQQTQGQQPARQPQPTVAYQDAESRRVAPAERGSALYNRIYQAYEEADKKGINHIKAAQAAIEAARANGEISPEQDIDLDAIVRTAREDFYDNKSKETARQLMGVLPEGRPTRDDAIAALGNLYYSEKFQKEIDDALKKGTVIPNPNREVYVREYLLSNLSDMLQKERGYTANEARSIASQLFYKDEHIAREVDAHLQQDYDKMADTILSKYDTDNSAEQVWNQAEEKSNAEYRNYMSGRGAFADETGQAIEGFATHLKYHDLQRMADAAWNRLGQKQNAIIKELSQVLKQRYPQATPEQITKAAKEWARQRSDERLFNLAVAKNAPQSETEFFFRKVFASNAITKLMEAAARAKAGTIGDWETRDKAEAEYGKGFGRQVVGGLGTAVGFALDPSLLIAAGAGGAAVKGSTWLGGKIIGEAGMREGATTLAGRVLLRGIGGAANFGAFESANEVLNQIRHGGELTVDEKTGHYSIKPYSAKAIGKQALHGVVMGGTIGAIAPLTGNVFSNLVKSTQSTAGKMVYRVGELGVGTVAEGTIFAVPDIASAYFDYNKYIQAVSDPKSKEYIADARERETVIADLEQRRNTTMVDAWTDSMAMMAGFKLHHAVKSVPNVISELSKKPNSKAGFETRLRSLLDGRNDLALTKDEKAELERRGYSDLSRMVEDYSRYHEEKERYDKARPTTTDAGKMITGGSREEDLPYNRFVELMNDSSVSEAARAKMYYYLTGHVLPMSTVMGSSVTEENGGYTVQSIGANGVITSRTFDSQKKAEAELQRINRQAELNSIEIGEKRHEYIYQQARLYEACRQVEQETGVPARRLFELTKEESSRLNEYERDLLQQIEESTKNIGDTFTESGEDGVERSNVAGLQKAFNEEYGVDIDKIIAKEPNGRSEKEQEVLQEYAVRLFGMKGRQESDEAPISPDAPPTDSQISGLLTRDDNPQGEDDNFRQGYKTTDEEAMQDARYRMEVSRQKIKDRFLQAERFLNDIDADPIGTLSWATLSDDDRQVVLDYINAKAVYDGMIQRVRDDIDMEVAQATAAIDNRVAPVSGGGDGMIHPATLKIDDRQVDIIGGRVVMTEDGTMVDTANSDKDIIIRDRETGKVEFVDIHDILNIGDVLDPEQLKSEQAQNITSQLQQEAADKIDGTLSFAQGDTYQLPDEEGNVHTLIVGEDQGDGTISVYMDGREEPEVVSKAWLQQMQDDKNRARVEEAEAAVEPEVQEGVATEPQQPEQPGQTEEPEVYEGATEVPEGNEETEGTMGTEGAEGVEGAEAPEPMPMRGAGENAEPDFYAVTPERGHRYLYDESGLPQKVADNMVKANLDAAEKEWSKQQKAIEKLENNPGTNPVKYQQKRKELDEKQQAAQAAKDYWTAVKGEQDKRDAAIVAERAAQEAKAREQAKADEEARQAEEIAKREEQEKLGSNNVSDVIKKKWQDAKKVEGFANEIPLPNGEKVKGRYMLVESGAATPSHNPNAEFVRNEGFPVDENGQTVNDRDYERDPDAQEITRRMGANYDSRALQSVPVVSADGIVLSGNGRTMAGELAAQNNTDGAYLDYLRQYSNLFGFTPEQIGEFTHPRVVFVPDSVMPYTTDTFAKFNERDTKGQSKTEKAVKMSKVVDDAVFGRITRAISGYDNINDFYNDAKATTEAVNELRKAGAIGQMDYAEMFDGDKLSNTGKDVLESVLIGKAFEGNPDVIRMMTKHKSIRQRVVSALAEITNNMQFGEDYALSKELSEAIKLTYDALEHGFKVGERVSPHARQQNLFTFDDGDTVADYTNATIMMLADVMNDAATDKGDKKVTLKKVMTLYNQRAQDSANGQADIFSGGVKSEEEILKEVLNLLQYGTEKEKRTALKSAAEQRKSAATRPDGEGEGVQQDGAVSRSNTGSEPERAEGSAEPAPVEPEPTEDDFIRELTSLINDYESGENGFVTERDLIERARDLAENLPDGSELAKRLNDAFADYDKMQDAYYHENGQRDDDGTDAMIETLQQLTSTVAEPNAVQAVLAAAEAETNTEPTEAQKEAGNYKKGHVKIDGYDVTIENPKGSVRRGTDGSGKQWEQEMQNTYGYIRGTEGVDGDHIDVFFSDDPSQGDVFVVDQVNKDGSFDEHKVMYGFPDIESARKAYLSNYEDGWQGLGAITPVSKEEFKKWIDSSHRKTKPFAEYSSVKPLGDTQLGEKPKTGQAERKTQGLEGYTDDEILLAVRGDIEMKLEDAGIDGVSIKDMAIHGSRKRGDARDDSDLDVVVEYDGNISEDGLFNILNEKPLEIEGIRIDINPITKGKSGTLEQYMERSRKYDAEQGAATESQQTGHGKKEEKTPAVSPEVATLAKEYKELSDDADEHFSKTYQLEGEEKEAARKEWEEKLTAVVNAKRKLQNALRKASDEDLKALATYNKNIARMVEDELADRQRREAEAETFDVRIKEQKEYAGKGMTKPLSKAAADFAENNNMRPVMGGIYHDEEGFGVVSDGHILLASTELYDKKNKGKIIAVHNIKNTDVKKGDEIQGVYPKWRSIANKEGYQTATVDWQHLSNFLAGITDEMKTRWQAAKEGGEKTTFAAFSDDMKVALRMPDGTIILFKGNNLAKFVNAAQQLGAKEVGYLLEDSAITASSKKGTVLLMPMIKVDDNSDSVLGEENVFFYDNFKGKEGEKKEKLDEPVHPSAEQPTNEGVSLSSAGKDRDLFGNVQEKPKKSSSEAKIDDVGEHLAGARKDMRREIAMTLSNITEAALVEKPFGKVYKKPDLKKAVESGALREKDAIFYEALFSMVNQQKPKVTQSETRSKRFIPDYKTKAERWAASTFKQMEVLRQFMELDEAGRDAMMEKMLADRFPTREQELAEIEKRKGWNQDREDHKYEWGDKTTPNPLWVVYEVMNRLGYNIGDKLDLPFGVVVANSSGTGYGIENLKGERHYTFGSKMTLDEAIDAIVYLSRLKRGDSDISHPTQFFSFQPTRSEYGESGRYRVMWGSDFKTREFDNKEEADAFAQTKKGAFVSPISEVKRQFGYKVRFSHPLTGERLFVDDEEFDTKGEAQAYFDGNFEKINDSTNTMLQKEREKKGEKKTLTADDIVHVAMVRADKDGWTHAVIIDKKYANNDGQIRIIKEGFANRQDAKAFSDSIKEEVLKIVQKHKEEAKNIVYFDTGENSRIGEDYRGGKDVEAEDFMNTFGFRGVQFGNWTNQADRQMAVNQAYDAFMDLAKLLDVSPKALSLNGELGIAFGARGVGGFAAHYEPVEVVINLTKTQGAGSLAHEWWHALDNYFARREGSPLDMVTDNRRIEMRDELRKAFNDMLDQVKGSDYAIRSISKGEYWGRTHEITARLLAEWVDQELKKRGELNTFLSRGANIERGQESNYSRYKTLELLAGREPVSFDDYKKMPESLKGIPYPSEKEVEQFGSSLRHIFDTMEERVNEETGDVELFRDDEDDNIEAVNDKFNEELQQQIDGTLPKGHVYDMGMPGDILLSTVIADVPIQLNSARLDAKSNRFGHNFDLSEIKDLVKAVNMPVAVFAYGNKEKAQNIIVEIQHEGKNFVVGLSIRPSVSGRVLEINSIRNVFPKKNAEWLNWINQGKLLYVNKEKIQALIDQQRTILADVEYLDLDSAAKIIENFENPSIEDDIFAENGDLFREVEDAEIIEQLEREPKVKVYRAMQLIDGELYPPMSAKVDGEMRKPTRLGVWEEAEERPDLADANGYFKLDKGNKKSLKARYNPYIHTSRTMLNDQFSEAQNRDNLVVVEMEVPASELTSGYQAEKAKDSVGAKQWKAGVIQGQLSGTREVILSRWAKPVRIVPVEEVADHIVEELGGQVPVMPSNVVTPQQREALEARGIQFVETDNSGKIVEGDDAGKTWKSVYGKKRATGMREREGEDVATQSQQTGRQARNAGWNRSAAEERQRAEYAQRQWRRAHEVADEWVEKLGIGEETTVYDSIDDVPGVENFSKRKRKAKGWFDVKTGKIVIILGNHRSPADVLKTILHEAVSHYGLRKLFGKHFDNFLDNVYHFADFDIKMRISAKQAKLQQRGKNSKRSDEEWRRVATEEYLSELAESTDFENAEKRTWLGHWMHKIKELFFDMLHKLGLKNLGGGDTSRYEGTITDNELRYILWRSYKNMTEPGRYRNPFAVAEDTAMEHKLKVGEFEERVATQSQQTRTDIPGKTGRAAEQGEATYVQMNNARAKNFSSYAAKYFVASAGDEFTFDEKGKILDAYNAIKAFDDSAIAMVMTPYEYVMINKDAIELRQLMPQLAGNKPYVVVAKEHLDMVLPALIRSGYRVGIKTIEDGSVAREEGSDIEWHDDDEARYNMSDEANDFHTVINEMFDNADFDKSAHQRERYDLGKTPAWMKRIGISGDRFSLSFKNIKEHKGKDADHDLTREEWHQLPDALKKPFAVTRYNDANDRFRLYVNIMHNGHYVAVGVDVKRVNQGRNLPMLEVNSIKTVFAHHGEIGGGEKLITYDKKITPEQEALLRGLNFREYPTIQEFSAAKIANNSETASIEGRKNADEELLFNDGEDEGVDAGEDDPDAEGYDAGKKNMDEMITEGLVQLAQQNRDNVQLRINTMRNIGGNLAKLRQAMARQREYDRSTVDGIVRLAKMVIDSGFFKNLSIYDVKRLMGMVNRAAGKEDITKQANEVVDMLLQHQIKDLANILYDQMKVKGSKVNAKGVEVQGQLDLDGQRMVAAMKDAMGLDENSIAQRLGDINDKMGSDDATIAANAAVEYQGVMLAKQYLDEIKASEIEEKNLRHELKESHETTSERDRHTDSYRQYVASVQDAIRENRLERISAYGRLIGNLGTGMKESVERAKAWREREQQRVNEIYHNANSDLQGVPTDEHRQLTWTQRAANWDAVRFFMKPLATFDTLLRYFGSKSVDGKGYLWNRFMGGWTDANDKEWRSLRAAHKILDDKVSEIMGRKMRWSDLFAMERKMPTVDIAFKDGDGEKYHELTQGNMLYIYMVNKMSDGRMKLRRMGIDEDDVEFITEKIDPRFIQLADWIQDVFLKEKRNEYNAVHERMFGAPMAAIENYFPLKINDRSRGKEEDVGTPTDSEVNPSTITGSIIKRVRNSLPLDVTGADAFDVVLEHLQQMEHWAAFAELNQDMNALLSYKRFRNRVLNMSSARYGAGKTLWENFKDACAIAAGVYRPKTKRNSLDATAANVAKGVTAAKIAFRIYTAFKQLMSYPAYLSEASIVELAKSSNPVGAAKAWNWAIEQLPGFAERWQSRQAGDSRLRESDADWGLWKNKIIETASRWGMSPNAFVDGLTVAMGAKAIYETKKRRYKDDGYSDEEAKKLALRDASVAYNETQQSSGNAYLSSMQLDRTVASVALTVFRNASMGYQRRMVSALSNLKRKLKPGYRAESIEFMAKQMLRDGLDEEQAASAARRAYNRSWFRDIADTLIFGFVLQLTWNLAPYIPYLLLGDDDDEKDKMLEDATLHALAGGVEGLTGGSVMSELYNRARSGKDFSSYNFNLLPLMSDLQTTLRHFKNDEVMAANDIINLLVQSSIGVNPQTFTDAFVAIMDAAEGDLSTGKEIAMMLMRLGQVPQTQLDNLYIDELGMSAKDAKGHSLEDLARRYATYKRRKDAPLTGILYDDTERAAAEKRHADRFQENVTERIASLSDEALGMNYDRSGNDLKLKKVLGNEAAKRLGAKEDYYGKSKTDYGEIYLRKRSYFDLAEDVLLQTEESKAKAAGNDDRTKEVSSARSEITNIKKELRDATSAQEIEDIMERLRQRRRELMQELGIVK